ncbi:hypothetical protein [Staphylothermus hellenicus]|uniref:Uncharacterized protein n=1 Tax=Staphylothermus hellenicus (strain DSM 12710 / JCM 10830 / BK20S6-10-b1 / P8) TaxID=591019 RepID=D7DAQ9_STAHD|nr:hypothetical protein [Staphylothermus hellenicus]ADI31256.1 hypothetical protein Shell_0109 [Staphylothermus hellenicus DSM 12710]
MHLSLDNLRSFLVDVGRLYNITSAIKDYYDEVVRPLNGKNIDELPRDLKVAVLGGLKPDGEYVDNAYAMFIKDFIGLYIEDPKLYVFMLKRGRIPSVKIITSATKFVEFVYLLNGVSGFIISKARNLGLIHNSVKSSKTEINQLNIEDAITELINTILNLSVGTNSFTTGIWGLRKTTLRYAKKAYGKLPENLLEVLGFSKLVDLKNYQLWGFPDYVTKCRLYQYEYNEYGLIINGLPIVSEYLRKIPGLSSIALNTLGGAICILNEVIWRYIDLLYKDLNKWYKNSINLEKEYVRKAWRSLDEIGWSMPEYLKSLYVDFREALDGRVGSSYGSPFKFLHYDENGVIKEYTQWFYRGSYERSGFYTYKLSQYIYLPELLDDLMPAIYLGVVDTTLYLNSGRALLILIRSPSREKL